MDYIKPILLMLVGFFSFQSLSHAQTITLQEYLSRLEQVHPLFEIEKLSPRIEREKQEGFLGAEDWNIASNFGFSRDEPLFNFSGPDRIDAYTYSSSFGRTFWKTGGRLTASSSTTKLNLNLPATDDLTGFPTNWYQKQYDITYTHPLLKNRGGFLDRLQYDLKQYDIDVSEIIALENKEKFLVGVVDKFNDWVFLTEQKKIIQERLQLSEDEFGRTTRKMEANLIEKVDVFRAEDAVRIAKQNQVLTESQWRALQGELAVLLQDEKINNFSPEHNLYEVRELMPFDKAVSYLRNDSWLIKILTKQLDKLGYARRGFKEQTKPDLVIVAQISTRKIDENYTFSLNMDKTDAFVGLQYSRPLGNRTAISKVNQTELQILKVQKQVDNMVLNLTSALTNLYIQITEMEKVLDLNQKQIESAKDKTQEELKIYNQGRGDLTFVIQGRDNEQTAKLLYARNALTYQKLILQYRALLDNLL